MCLQCMHCVCMCCACMCVFGCSGCAHVRRQCACSACDVCACAVFVCVCGWSLCVQVRKQCAYSVCAAYACAVHACVCVCAAALCVRMCISNVHAVHVLCVHVLCMHMCVFLGWGGGGRRQPLCLCVFTLNKHTQCRCSHQPCFLVYDPLRESTLSRKGFINSMNIQYSAVDGVLIFFYLN